MVARLLARLRRDRRAVSTIELGLLAPVLALFIAGIVDLSQGLAQRFAMQQAVNRGLELLAARPLEADKNDDDVDFSYITTEAASAAGVPTSQVRVRRWLQCDDQAMTTYDSSCASGQDQSRYLELEIDKTFRGSFFVSQFTMTATGTVRIQ